MQPDIDTVNSTLRCGKYIVFNITAFIEIGNLEANQPWNHALRGYARKIYSAAASRK